jgi:hypothetical protein
MQEQFSTQGIPDVQAKASARVADPDVLVTLQVFSWKMIAALVAKTTSSWMPCAHGMC